MARAADPPVLLVKWCDLSKWLLERVDRVAENSLT
jgi:hypothetical protein